MELSVIQSTIVSAIGTIGSIALGFGLFSATTEQLAVSSAGTLVSLGFTLWTELRVKTKVAAAAAAGDQATLARIAGR